MGAVDEFEQAHAELRMIAARAARSVVGPPDALDVADEAVVRAWLHWHLLDREAARAWIARVARNIAIDRVRRDSRLRPATPAGVSEFEDDVVRQDEVASAIASLPERQRDAVQLRHFDGLSQREVAQVLGIERSTAAVHLSRGEATLRSRLSDHRPEERTMPITTIEEAVDAMVTGVVIPARVTGATEHALLVDVGIPATMAARHVDVDPVRDLTAWVGRDLDCVVRTVIADKHIVFVSRLHAVESRDHRAIRRAWFHGLAIGDRLPGAVSSQVAFGWFIELENGTGLLHNSLAADREIAVGDRIEVEVIAVDVDRERISLGP